MHGGFSKFDVIDQCHNKYPEKSMKHMGYYGIVFMQFLLDTVDGSEIRRAPVDLGSLSHLQSFSTIPGGFLAGFLNHQQYVPARVPFKGWLGFARIPSPLGA